MLACPNESGVCAKEGCDADESSIWHGKKGSKICRACGLRSAVGCPAAARFCIPTRWPAPPRREDLVVVDGGEVIRGPVTEWWTLSWGPETHSAGRRAVGRGPAG